MKNTIQLEDGEHYFDATPATGAMPAHRLREIADQIDAMNAPQRVEIDRYFEKNAEPVICECGHLQHLHDVHDYCPIWACKCQQYRLTKTVKTKETK